MNTIHDTRITTRTAAFAACLIAAFAGATACGTEDGTATAPAAIGQPKSDSFLKSNQPDQAEYLRQLQSKRDAFQAHRYGDDRRQPTGQAPAKHTSQHPSGYDKALDQR